jgi:hypothetical protein
LHATFDQIARYNMTLNADYLMVTEWIITFAKWIWKWEYQFLPELLNIFK